MELDFASIQALSSTTRLRILKQLLEKESTPTDLSDRVDRSKSTVTSHLDVLCDAGLVEKDAEEGRRRVIYRPTDKAKVILHGGERRVRFTVGSVVLTSLLAVGSVYRFMERRADPYLRDATEAAPSSGSDGGMGTMALDQANTTATRAAEAGMSAGDYALIGAAGLAAVVAVVSVAYLGIQLYMSQDTGPDAG